jgi:hypothetical protein
VSRTIHSFGIIYEFSQRMGQIGVRGKKGKKACDYFTKWCSAAATRTCLLEPLRLGALAVEVGEPLEEQLAGCLLATAFDSNQTLPS